MITKLRVKNYRSLADVDVELGPLNVLVGPNGAGKSTLIDTLRFVAEALRGGIDAAVTKRNGLPALRRWSYNNRAYDIEIALTIQSDDFHGEYALRFGSGRRSEYRVKWERGLARANGQQECFETQDGKWQIVPAFVEQLQRNGQRDTDQASDAVRNDPVIQPWALMLPLLTGLPPLKRLYEYLTGMSFYNIQPEQLKKPQEAATSYPLEERGENLASVLRAIKQSRSEATADLERALSRVIGDVQKYEVRQVAGYLVTRLLHMPLKGQEEKQAPRFELAQESDGTLRLLGIVTAFYQYPPRTLIGLEEPEMTIHPGAMSLLWEEIQDASRRSQILITTHSPDLLDLCQAEQLRVVEKVDGVTQVGPIAAAQKQIIQERLFSPGQLLQAQGRLQLAREK